VPPSVVCGVDGSRHAWAAAHLASDLARRLGLGLELVHVSGAGEASDLSRARSLRDDLCRGLGRGDLPLRLETGRVGERLLAVAGGAAMLVVGTRGNGALRRALLGSVSVAVTRRPPVPVVVVPPGAVNAYGRPQAQGGIVCAVRDDADVAVAHAAAHLATRLHETLTLVHVVAPAQVPISAAGGAPPAMLPPRTADQVAAARQVVEDIARRVQFNADGRARVRVLEGPVGPQLTRIADLTDAALVAVGSSERGALTAALAGSASRYVMRRGAQPVIVCPREPWRLA
jgi:nucleotide-binding universal stress UspA family protein